MGNRFKKLLRRTEINYYSFIWFVVKLIFWVSVPVWLTLFLFPLFINIFKKSIALSDFILFITAGFIIAYTYETRKMGEQIKEGNLRPVILRSGFVENWQKIKFRFHDNKLVDGKPLEFTILKNVATDINGYIVIDGYKYKLLFGNYISKIEENIFYFSENWGWMRPDTKLSAVYKEDSRKKTMESNKILLNYEDIEGDRYFTVEDSNFSQKTFKK